MIPKRRSHPRMNVRESSVIRCPGHLKWVRGLECCLADHWWPDDSTVVPLCAASHASGHQQGWATFQKRWRVDLVKIAADLWKASPHRIKYEREQRG